MATSRWLVRSAFVAFALQAAGCVDAHSRDNMRASTVAQDTSSESPVPEKLLTVTESSMRDTGFVASSLPPAPADDALLSRARAVLAAARPGFREWPANAYATVLPDSTLPWATTGPLVGDFDGDGMPDVVFDGHDGRIMVTSAVLSNNGQPKIVSVEEGFDVPDPLTPRKVRFVVAPYTFKGKRGVGVGFVSYDASGSAMLPATIFMYVNGHFAELIEGE